MAPPPFGGRRPGACHRDACERGPLFAVRCDGLYQAWRRWAEDNGQRPGTSQSFGRDLRAVIPQVRVEQPREDDGKQRRWYRGVGLKGEIVRLAQRRQQSQRIVTRRDRSGLSVRRRMLYTGYLHRHAREAHAAHLETLGLVADDFLLVTAGGGGDGDDMIDWVKSAAPSDPELPVLVAGEPERIARAERLAKGIEVDDETWSQLAAIAQRYQIAVDR